MELPLIAIIISAVVLLLQVVSLVIITGMRKSLKNVKEVRPPLTVPAERFEKKNVDFRRHERRPYQDQRPPAPAAAITQIDPVEKSLRDINLRLKSAERDQEFARRKIQENFPRGDQGDQHRDRDDHNRRGNRDRDHHRNHRRDNWQERNRSSAPQQQQQSFSAAPPQQVGEPEIEKKIFTPFPELQAPVQKTVPETAPNAASGAADFTSDENLQHGRKIIVNRRTLKDEPSAGAPIGAAADVPVSSPMSPPADNSGEETRISPDAPPQDTEIRFGRR